MMILINKLLFVLFVYEIQRGILGMHPQNEKQTNNREPGLKSHQFHDELIICFVLYT